MVSTMAIPTHTEANIEEDHFLTAMSASADHVNIISTEQQVATTAGNSVLSPTIDLMEIITDDESFPITATTTKPAVVPR